MKSNHTFRHSGTSRRTFDLRWIYLSVALINPAIAVAQNAIDVGSRKQLFIDHKFIESAEGIRLVMNPPHQTREKLIVADQPWERDGWVASYSTVIQENGKVRMWYQISAGTPEPGKNPPMRGVAYAESTDGLQFTKPVLGLVERDGSRENNLVLPPNLNLMTVDGCSAQ